MEKSIYIESTHGVASIDTLVDDSFDEVMYSYRSGEGYTVDTFDQQDSFWNAAE